MDDGVSLFSTQLLNQEMMTFGSVDELSLTPAWVVRSVASVCLSVCLSVRALKEKRLELSTKLYTYTL